MKIVFHICKITTSIALAVFIWGLFAPLLILLLFIPLLAALDGNYESWIRTMKSPYTWAAMILGPLSSALWGYLYWSGNK